MSKIIEHGITYHLLHYTNNHYILEIILHRMTQYDIRVYAEFQSDNILCTSI